jgi:hypothetical protein
MWRRNASFVYVWALAFLSACGGGGAPDGGDAEAGAPPVDAPADRPSPGDTGSDASAALFGPCASAAQCPGGTAAVCIRVSEGYPEGMCTRRCTSDSQCGGDGACVPFGRERRCFPRCLGGTDCRAGYNCFTYQTGSDARACFPLCTSDAQCPGSACNIYTGFCGTADTARADNGGTCLENGDCRSNRCLEEYDTASGEPTGNLDGMCYSLCTIPDDDAYRGMEMPRGSCPANSVCVRGTMSLAGDVGICRFACRANTDCRPGYICVHPRRLGGSSDYANGYCAAMNCHYMTQTCPPFATCLTTRTGDGGVPVSGLCARSDGGASDAATDATADAPTDATADAGGLDASAGG